MSRAGWERFVPLLRRYDLKPILGIVPENTDSELVVDAEDAGFWAEMLEWQAAGAAIGLHGYRHVCESAAGGLIPLHARTEFAGVAEERQREWIRAGLTVLRGHGLEARVWVAPRHGFDAATLKVLKGEGIEALSDGFAREPFREGGLVWVPQQLWGPREKADGVWTICLHANTASDGLVRELEAFLERFAGQFTSVDALLAEGVERGRSVGDRVFHVRMMGKIWVDRRRKRWFGR